MNNKYSQSINQSTENHGKFIESKIKKDYRNKSSSKKSHYFYFKSQEN